ncbi:MAG: cyclopropane fatty acyl phospholipid synthase [Pseudomonadota bacterium]|nr:cyclopropane fatty acyl phospholipid synthase [Pseudomonadota bacterium]MDO7710415.1 cyclopropane fatty acyl phospholipid synthase [Pseudomonadota bacterium]
MTNLHANKNDRSSGKIITTISKPPEVLRQLVEMAGVSFNGNAGWDIQVHKDDVYRQILAKGSLGFGESYVAGHWDSCTLDELFHRLVSFDVDQKLVGRVRLRLWGELLRQRFINLQSSHRAFVVGEQHYDIGNDVFESMLDSTMSYSCAYWQDADNLEQAQLNKLDLICHKLELKPGQKLLEIGCGWGGLARHAAKHYGVEVLGITISKEQQKLAQERCVGLPVKIELMDYRDLKGRFDKVVSVGMFEHVGPKNYPIYFDTISRLLEDEGLFLLHSIGVHKTTGSLDPWTNKYIFPNGRLPSAEQLTAVLNGRFLIEDWHNFGHDYDLTLMAWWDKFNAAWPQLESKYNMQFYRMWKYYLMSCAGFFRSGQGQLWQIVLTKPSRKKVYRSVR